MHNETGNIWTHLLGALFIVVLMIASLFTFPKEAHISDHLMFLAYLLCALHCLVGSTVFHTLFCHSDVVYYRLACVDYMGISTLVGGSFCLVTYYLYYCHFFYRCLYLSVILGISIGGVVGPFLPSWHKPAFRVYRATFYIALGVLSAWPAFHHMYEFGLPKHCHFWTYLLVVVGYVSGASIYACRIPER